MYFELKIICSADYASGHVVWCQIMQCPISSG